jgi:deoxyribose-phosphate aldolase
MNPEDVAGYIDHTQLKPEATDAQIDELCSEAIEHSFCSVCVNSCWVPRCAEKLEGSGVKLAAVAGFPLGAMATGCKANEAAMAVESGADEIDMVMNVGFLKSGRRTEVVEDVKAVRDACSAAGEGRSIVLKVIIETALLSDDEKVEACRAAVEGGADFVKTSTGFSKGGATVEDVALMRKTVGPDIGVKASGGVRSFEDARKMIEAGATRIGASSSVAIVSETGGSGSY